MAIPNDYQWEIIKGIADVLGMSWWHCLSEESQKRILNNLSNINATECVETIRHIYCDRCKPVHDVLPIKKLQNKPDNFSGFTYWAICPTTKEPLLTNPGHERRALDEMVDQEDRKIFKKENKNDA